MLFRSGLGIYFHENGLCMAYLKRSFKSIKVAGQASYVIEPDKGLSEKLNLAADYIKDFINTNRISSPDVFIGIPREMVILRDIEFPFAVKENLRATIEYKIENYVPLKSDDIYFDCQIIDEVKEKNQLRVLIVVVRREVIDSFLILKSRLGLGLTGIGISSTALVNYFSYHPDTAEKKEYAYIYINHHGMHIGAVKNNMLQYSRIVDLRNGEDRQRVIDKELKPITNFFAGDTGPIPTIICTDKEDPSILEILNEKKNFQLIVPQLSRIDTQSSLMVPAFGLALRELRKVPMDINLLPAGMRKRPGRTAYYLLLILVSLCIIFCLSWGGSKLMRQRLRLNTINEETERLLAEIKNIDRIRSDLQELEDRIEFLNELWRGQVPVLEILKEVTIRIPEDTWIRDFSYDEKGVSIYGYADSASELITLLEKSPLFKDVVFLSTITKDRAGKKRFRIGFKLNS